METRTGARLVAAALPLALLLALPANAGAAPPPVPDPDGSAPVVGTADPGAGRWAAAGSDPTEPGVPIGEDEGRRVLLDRQSRPVAPGIELTSFDWVAAQGFIRGQVLSVELGDGRVRPDYLFPGTVADTAPLDDVAEERGAVAAVNGDFFDINNTSAPLGVGLAADGPVKGPVPGHDLTVGFDDGGLGHVTRSLLEGVITLPGGASAPLAGYNQHQVGPDGIGAFTELWGGAGRSRLTEGAERVREVAVTDGVVTAVAEAAGTGAIAAGTTVLVGRDGGADALAGLTVGDAVGVTHDLRFTGPELRTALGGNVVLVADGQVVDHADPAAHPRTAVGFTADGRRMVLVSIDGRIAASRGMTYRELGEFLVELGATEAVNLDGGGSSTMLAREAGAADLDVENTPSDGALRPVPNGLGLFAAPGSGRLTGMRVAPTADDEDPDLRRVFPGLTRRLTALGHDETLAPVPADPRWITDHPRRARVDRTGLVTAGDQSGPVTVTARERVATGSTALQVLEPLDRLRPSTDVLTLVDRTATATFRIIGADRGGFETTVEPADVTLDYDPALVRVEPDDAAGWTVIPLVDQVATTVTATVGDERTAVGVGVGVTEQVLADFDTGIEGWTFGSARGVGQVAADRGEDGTGALRIDYDFTRSTATRTAFAAVPGPTPLDGRPLRIGVDVLSGGRGEWTSFSVRDAEGVTRSLYGTYLTEPGWQRVTVDVPQTLTFPITVTRFTVTEPV